MTDLDALSAHDLRTVSCMPVTPERLGWEDARYQHVYWNPFQPGTPEYAQYHDGHGAGMRARRESEAA